MIKIAVISPENSIPFIKKGIKENDKYCVEYFIYENLEETVDIYKKNFHKFDVFLTSGELGKIFLEGKLKKINQAYLFFGDKKRRTLPDTFQNIEK